MKMRRFGSEAVTVAATALCATLVHATTALGAPPNEAEAVFEKGVAALEAGRFDEACPSIQKSYDLDPQPGTLFTLAECEAKRGRSATALARYDDYLALYAKLPADKKRRQGDRAKVSQAARDALAEIAPEITLTLAPGAPSGTVVTRDGETLAATALGAPMRLDPGEHTFATQAPGAPRTEKILKLEPRDRKTVQLEVAAPPAPPPVVEAPPPPPPPPPAGPSGRRIGAFVAGGVGVAGLLIGAVTGGLAVAKKGTVTRNCGIGGDPTACNPTGFAAANGLKTLGAASTAGFVIAGIGAATGVVLFVTEPKPSDAKPGDARPADPKPEAGARVRLVVAGAGATLLGSW